MQEILFWGHNRNILLEGSQSSSVRPSDKGNVKAKVLGLLEIVSWSSYISNIYKFSSYLTGNTLHLRYKAQPVNAV
jgi:hypothetical protein